MYTDNTLTPKEAVRLCALGTLSIQPMPYGAQSSMSYGAQSSMPYGALAESIRHFVSHVIGPSLDVMGQAIELLRYEGLVDFIQNDGEDDELLVITGSGRDALKTLLLAPVRMGATELNKLIIALKFRFLHVLDATDQQGQILMLTDYAENELVRLSELRRTHAADEGHIASWLDHDIELARLRVQWLEDFTTHK